MVEQLPGKVGGWLAKWSYLSESKKIHQSAYLITEDILFFGFAKILQLFKKVFEHFQKIRSPARSAEQAWRVVDDLDVLR